jgi:FkbM family methyltransferase
MMRYYHLFKSFKNWRIYLAHKFGLAVGGPLLFETRNGVWVEVPERLFVPNAVIIDIGANAGYFTLFATSRFPGASLFAYEPIPVNYTQLKRHCDLNQSRNILCFNLAVAGHCGEIQLSFDASDSFTTSATMLSAAKTTNDSLSVACVTLQKIFDDNSIEKCDLLKMDCEGAEYDILYSCPRDYIRRIDQIAMEVHGGKGKNKNIDALDLFLRQQGFLTRRRPGGMLWAWR